MIFLNATATRTEVRISREGDEPCGILHFFTGCDRVLSIGLDRTDFVDLLTKMIECDEDWPTEPPAEEPTAEDDRELNHGPLIGELIDVERNWPTEPPAEEPPAEEPTVEDEAALNHGPTHPTLVPRKPAT